MTEQTKSSIPSALSENSEEIRQKFLERFCSPEKQDNFYQSLYHYQKE